jgi:hypothetical protein
MLGIIFGGLINGIENESLQWMTGLLDLNFNWIDAKRLQSLFLIGKGSNTISFPSLKYESYTFYSCF